VVSRKVTVALAKRIAVVVVVCVYVCVQKVECVVCSVVNGEGLEG